MYDNTILSIIDKIRSKGVTSVRRELADLLLKVDKDSFMKIVKAVIEYGKDIRDFCSLLSDMGSALELWDPKVELIFSIMNQYCERSNIIDFKIRLKHRSMILGRLCDLGFYEIGGTEITYIVEVLLNEEFPLDSKFFEEIRKGLSPQELSIGSKIGMLFSRLVKNVGRELLEAAELLRIKLDKLGLSYRKDFSSAILNTILKIRWPLGFEEAMIIAYALSFLGRLSLEDMWSIIKKLAMDAGSISGISLGFALSLFRHFLTIFDHDISPANSQVWLILSELLKMDTEDFLVILSALRDRSIDRITGVLALEIISSIYREANDARRKKLLEVVRDLAHKFPRRVIKFLKNISQEDMDEETLGIIFDIIGILIRTREELGGDVASVIKAMEYYVAPRTVGNFLSSFENVKKLLLIISQTDDPRIMSEIIRFIKSFSPIRLLRAGEIRNLRSETEFRDVINTVMRKISKEFGETEVKLLRDMLGV